MEHSVLIIIFFVLCLVLPLECRTRKPAVSGRWYPSDPEQLKMEIKGYLDSVDMASEKKAIEPLGLIVPHAGFMFSGPVAAYSYKLLEGRQYDTVILLGSSHHYLKGIVSVYDGDILQTPMGDIAVDTEMVDLIISETDEISCYEAIHTAEHSNEAQLPFLQYVLKDFEAVSILTSTNNPRILAKAADRIYEAVKKSGKKVLLINSTDMSHFHPYKSAKQIDQRTIDLILAENWAELRERISYRDCELCGYLAFEIFQQVLEKLGCGRPVFLHYANSGDAHPEYGLEEVVGYGAIVFPQLHTEEKQYSNQTSSLGTNEKIWLLNLARKSISSRLEGRTVLPDQPESPLLKEERAVFVTLHKRGQLRGCIGHMIAQDELYKAVWQMAGAAAFEDPRFARLTKEELAEIDIEISILTPMQKIDSLDEIVMGRDGVMVRQGYHSGVFLPQVARETGWDKETFLMQLCSSKAMLPPQAYHDPQTEIFIFQVEEFSEKEL